MKKLKTIAEYISAAPKAGQKNLRVMHAVLKSMVPKARQELKWRVPAFIEKRILFAYAGFKNHLSLLPTPAAIRPFKKELAKYKTGKGSIQFPYDKPLPKALIRKIAAFRIKEAREKDARWM